MPVVDLVVEKLKNGPKAFSDIVAELVSENAISFDDIGYLYSDMSLDHRFITIQNNVWDLSERYKYSDKIIDVKELNEDEEEIIEDDDEEEVDLYEDEEETYLQSLEKVGLYVANNDEDLAD